MIDINELRDRAATFGSDYLTDEEWVEVIDRLEAAEKAFTEAYQRGYATGQEEIAAELEFAKREIANLHDDISEWMDKFDALRANVERMEKIESAAQNLVKMKGRHNTEIAYRRLVATLEESK